MEAGEESWLFLWVLCVEHSTNQLKLFTDLNSTSLSEPASSNTPVYYSGVEAHIIVIMSPNEVLFHEFNKHAGMTLSLSKHMNTILPLFRYFKTTLFFTLCM